MPEPIIVGISGGVDSSVTALILKKQGFEVECVFMKNWEGESDQCTSEEDYKDALAVCNSIDIPIRSTNFSNEYWETVFRNFIDEYSKGRTPNPDVLCNKEVKFKAFLNYATDIGGAKIATGHYARIEQHNDAFRLLKGADPSKDQSYFLYLLDQKMLSKSLFPIGGISKKEVRKIAKESGLLNYAKKDSTGICFIGERPFPEFVQNYVNQNPGPIISDKGDQIGTHIGLSFYTLGQRQGLGIGGLRNYPDSPWYVLKKDITNNSLIVGQGNNNPLLFSSSLKTLNLELINKMNKGSYNLSAKIRYRQQDQVCKVEIGNDNAEVYFEEPQRAITPGQSLVLYSDDVCLGGGEIKEVN